MSQGSQQDRNGNGAAHVEEAPIPPYTPTPITVRSLLEAGAHYGHRAEKWNPKMLPWIFGEKNGVHILNLDITVQNWERARKFVVDVVSRGGNMLFVGTKDQARRIVKDAAVRCNSFYVNTRWLGGTLSNFETIKNSIGRMRKLEELLQQAEDENSGIRLNKKERLSISRQVGKLSQNLGGIRDMKKRPDIIFIVDINKESIAVLEALKLHIPVVAIVDSNTDPNTVAFPIPANDDAPRTISLFVNGVADAVIEGRLAYESYLAQSEVKPSADSSSDTESSGSEVEVTTIGEASVG